MADVFRARRGQPIVWFSRNLEQSNQFCPYCSAFLGEGASVPSDKEHLVGRNFVPAGSLGGDAFNFIFRACVECNSEKGEVERHISSVSLLTSAGRADDPQIDDLALRKASRDHHPVAKTKVVDAVVSSQFRYDVGPMTMTFKTEGPPQLDPRAVDLLAGRQVQALFALLTSEDPRLREKSRVLSPENVIVFDHYSHADWGNPQLVELEKRTSSWERLLLISTAKGYFKATLRRSPVPTDGFFWGLEWNRSVRVVGRIGDASSEHDWFTSLPPLEWMRVPSSNGLSRIRWETPISAGDDHLFSEMTLTSG